MLESIKSKITYRNKTYFGLIVIAIGFIFYLFCCKNLDVFDFILIMLPAIFLCIPSESIKNNKYLGYIFIFEMIIIIFLSLLGYLYADQIIIVNDYVYSTVDHFYEELVFELQFCYLMKIIYSFICLIASGMFLVPTKKR